MTAGDFPRPDFKALAELVERIGPVPRRELRCHPHVAKWLILTLPEAQPEFPFAGGIGSMTGIPVIEHADFEPGEWELREDGEVTAVGRIKVPSWVTAPIELDVTFPRVVDRPRLDLWFPIASPVPMALLSSIA